MGQVTRFRGRSRVFSGDPDHGFCKVQPARIGVKCTRNGFLAYLYFSEGRDGSMSKPPYRVLRIVLGFLSILLAVAGILLIFSSKPLIMRMFMHPPDSEISTLPLATQSATWRSLMG